MSAEITVIKQNAQGKEVWRYAGQVMRRQPASLLLQAYFDHSDRWFHEILFGKGDRFLEIYFQERWFNIFEIHDRQDDRVKGWYCNVTQPALIGEATVSYVDLALDLLVYPDGRQKVLDEDEFYALGLTPEEQKKPLAALEELRKLFAPIEKFSLDSLLCL